MPVFESEVVRAAAEAEAAAAAAAAEAARQAAVTSAEAEREAQLAQAHRCDSRDRRLVHAWVLVKAGARDVQADTFVEVTSGRTYAPAACPYYGIEFAWNHENYWVCMGMPEPHSDSRLHPAKAQFDWDDRSMWEAVLKKPLHPVPVAAKASSASGSAAAGEDAAEGPAEGAAEAGGAATAPAATPPAGTMQRTARSEAESSGARPAGTPSGTLADTAALLCQPCAVLCTERSMVPRGACRRRGGQHSGAGRGPARGDALLVGAAAGSAARHARHARAQGQQEGALPLQRARALCALWRDEQVRRLRRAPLHLPR